MIIIGLVMLISIPTLLIYQNHSDLVRKEVRLSQTRIALQKISDIAQNIYHSGLYSKETLKIYLPEGINSIVITKHEINANLDGFEVYVFSDVIIDGQLKSNSGLHYIEIESKNNGTNYVSIIGK